MTRFRCARCGAELTSDLVEIPLPDFEIDDDADDPTPLMPRGTYAVEPAPFGPPYVPATRELAQLHGFSDVPIPPGTSARRRQRTRWGRRREHPAPPRVQLSDGSRGTLVINPADGLGLNPHSDHRRLNGCCALDGHDGPNQVCAGCGAEVATLKNDCWVGRTTLRFEPAAVRGAVAEQRR